MIGSAVVKEALSRGARVAAVVRKNSPQIKNLPADKNLRLYECDLQDYCGLEFSERYDGLFHFAWNGVSVDKRDDVHNQIRNIHFTCDAVTMAKNAGCTVFVDAGSQAEYGKSSEKLNGSTKCNPQSGYGIAKYAAGKLSLLNANQLGVRHCHTRIVSTYGEGMSGKSIIIYVINTLLKGEKPSLTKCEQLWDYLYVKDTAKAFLSIAERGVHGKTYTIGSGEAIPLRDFIVAVRNAINPELPLGFGEKDYYPHQPMYLCADIAELTADTGWRPATPFGIGIHNVIEYVKGL